MTDLSPAAQQVFWEFNRAASGKPNDWHYLPAIAAALRAAADQVVPESITWQSPEEARRHWPSKKERAGQQDASWVIRRKLLAIAAELEVT